MIIHRIITIKSPGGAFMIKYGLAVFGLLVCFATSAGNNLQNPALNKVRFHEPAQHSPLVLLEKGKVRFAIAADLDKEKGMARSRKSVTRAAALIQNAFQKCAGKPIPVFPPDSPELKKYPVILALGDNLFTRRAGIDTRKMPKEGFAVKTFDPGKDRPGILVIAGYDGSFHPGTYDEYDWDRYRLNGTLHGAYDFIERFLECRFYFPGIGTLYPELDTLKISPVYYTDAPYLRNRFSHNIALASNPKSFFPEMGTDQWEDWEGHYRIAIGTRYWAGHAPPPSFLAAALPDLLKLIFYTGKDGYLYYNPKSHIGNFYDFSNLAFADLLLQDLKKHYESKGKDQSVWTNHDANSDYVVFGNCDTFVSGMDNQTIRDLKLIPDSIRGSRDQELSNVYARFVIYLASRLKKDFPGKRLSLIPYHNYVMPPTLPQYQVWPDNTDLRVCVYDFPVYIPNEKVVKHWKKQFEKYYEMLGGRPVTSLWLYDHPRNAFVRAVAGRSLAPIPKLFGKYLDRMELFWDYFGNHNWDMFYNYYIMWRCQWNPDFDMDAALEEMWVKLFGKAAPHVCGFYELLKERYEKYYAQKADDKITYNATVLNRLEQYLLDAKASVVPGSREEKALILFSRPWARAIKSMRGQLHFTKPQYKVIFSENDPQLQADVDDPQWKKAPKMVFRDVLGSGELGVCKTYAKLIRTEQGIHGLVVSEKRPAADPGKDLWNNCVVEFFISPGTRGDQYFQYAFDPLRHLFAGQKTEKPVATAFFHREDSRAKSFSRIDQDRWILHFFVPWSDLKHVTVKDYDTWLGNLIIDRKIPVRENLSFSMTLGNNHIVKQFGYFKFLGKGD